MRAARRALAQAIKRRATLTAYALALAFVLTPTRSPAQVNIAQIEIAHLLTFVGLSNCDFYRNGTWYTAAQAQAHLDEKLALLRTENKVQTADQFIERVATKSAFTNLPYRVRCAGVETINVSDWLGSELRHYRQCASPGNRCASRLARDAPDLASSGSAPDFNHRAEP
jgi:Family of unknown function (DUF5329)